MVYISESKDRCITLGEYIVDQRATVRATAKKFGISKSTVHKDVTQILKKKDTKLYVAVKIVLEKNKQERHLRGGEATKNKYKNKKSI
jgi:putative DeoR family transcriptional regulator (stage III sporulation protein D)